MSADGVIGVDHVGITVAELDRSLDFWCGLMGCAVVGRGIVEWPHLDRLVQLPDTRIEWVELAAPGGLRIELSQYHRPPGRPLPTGDENDPGRSHLSLLVADLVSFARRLEAAGVLCRSSVVDLEVGAYAGGRGLYVFDPDGVEIELIERAAATREGTGDGP